MTLGFLSSDLDFMIFVANEQVNLASTQQNSLGPVIFHKMNSLC